MVRTLVALSNISFAFIPIYSDTWLDINGFIPYLLLGGGSSFWGADLKQVNKV